MPDSGEIVVETFPFDGGRQVSAYVPARPVEAVVVAGDGQLIAPWGATLDSDDLPATMVVGVHRVDDETERLHEYSPAFEPERFDAHERFVVDDVRAWVRTRLGVDLPAERTAAFGVSASGELALALALRHPDLFGTVLCGSPGGGYRPPEPPEALPARLPRAYFVSGTLEPWFGENATRWARALEAAGAEVVSVEREGDHGGPFWRDELAPMVRWAFGGATTA